MVKLTKLYVGNLPESSQADELREAFEKYGRVEECDIVKNFAFVHMSSEDEAKVAIDNLNNSDFKGSKITVEASHSKVRQRPGMGGKGQCYRCGRQGHWSKECPRNPNARYGGGSMGAPLGVGYPDRGYSRYGAYSVSRGYAPDRMRPYPDLYDQRSASSAGLRPDDFFYYRRPYEEFSLPYDGFTNMTEDRLWQYSTAGANPEFYSKQSSALNEW